MTEQNKVNPEETSQDQGGQTKGNQGQQVSTQDGTSGSQPQLTDETLVELSDGQKVTFGELKKSRMMEADYRQKTSALAEERRRLEAEKVERERQRFEQPGWTGESEEVDPTQVLLSRLGYVEALVLDGKVKTEISRLQSQYPDADPDAVFKACWARPDLRKGPEIVEEEMRKDHERISKFKQPPPIEELLKADPKKDEELEAYYVNRYLQKKKKAASGGSGIATGEGSQIVTDENKPPEGYDGCKKKLLEDLENTSEIE